VLVTKKVIGLADADAAPEEAPAQPTMTGTSMMLEASRGRRRAGRMTISVAVDEVLMGMRGGLYRPVLKVANDKVSLSMSQHAMLCPALAPRLCALFCPVRGPAATGCGQPRLSNSEGGMRPR
jgi:hypothetical protein